MWFDKSVILIYLLILINTYFSFIFQADKENSKNPTLPFGIRKVQFHNLRKKVGKEYNPEELIWETNQWCIYSPSEGALWHHHNGCSEPLKAWINSSGDTLFVIGKVFIYKSRSELSILVQGPLILQGGSNIFSHEKHCQK